MTVRALKLTGNRSEVEGLCADADRDRVPAGGGDDQGTEAGQLKRKVGRRLKASVPMQTETGYRLEAVTTRKLEFENDAFAFGDKVVEKWYGTVEQGTNKGILVVVTTGKDGALTGGPDFMKVPCRQNPSLTSKSSVSRHTACSTAQAVVVLL